MWISVEEERDSERFKTYDQQDQSLVLETLLGQKCEQGIRRGGYGLNALHPALILYAEAQSPRTSKWDCFEDRAFKGIMKVK